MSKEDRVGPEFYLSLASKEENKSRGKLKIFLGMSAGVGKTYSMLEAAREYKATGGDVAIGIVYTHGRPETAALLEGIPTIPRKKITYKDAIFEEMDLDAVLKRRPKLVLIDELAHTNIVGSRHSKRWQDVLEVIDAGIDVYTTLNVQHMESRKEMVEETMGIQIQETVPDSVLENASEIKLVDISPSELLKRLEEGKVYIGDQSKIAVQNFFTEDHLTILRELLLKTASERVGHDLKTMIVASDGGRVEEVADRLIVAIDHTKQAEHLIRTSHNLAYNLNIPWVALYIDDEKELSKEEDQRLEKSFALARELGAEVLTTVDSSYKDGILRIARLKQCRHIVIGNSKKTFFQKVFFRESLAQYLLRNIPHLHLHILRKESLEKPEKWSFFSFSALKDWGDYWKVLSGFLFFVVLGSISEPFIGYQSVSILFLVGIFTLSLYAKKEMMFLATLATFLALDFFFIPPIGKLGVSDGKDWIFFIFYSVVSFFLAFVTVSLRNRERFLKAQEDESQILYDIVKQISGAPNQSVMFRSVIGSVEKYLQGGCGIELKQSAEDLAAVSESPPWSNENEKSVAVWVMKNGKAAGWATNTLSSVPVLFIPLKGFKEVIGVLSFRPATDQPLSLKKMNFLSTVAHELAAHLERYIYEEKERKSYYLEQAENFQHTIIDCIGQEFSKPLELLIEATKTLETTVEMNTPQVREQFKKQLTDSTELLHRLTKNFMDMALLSSGLLQIQIKLNDIAHLIQTTREKINKHLQSHRLVVNIEENLPSIPFDYLLMENALINLLYNAITYSSKGKTIEISAKLQGIYLELAVIDEGEGIPTEEITHVFKKFYRLPGTKPAGTGLGLSIVKAIIDIHKGRIRVHSRPEGGTEFCLIIPIKIS